MQKKLYRKKLNLYQFEVITGIHVTMSHTGKMQGIYSLSTSPCKNALCEKRKNVKNCVCAVCYSQIMMKRYDNLNIRLEANTDLLTSEIIPGENIPAVYSPSGYFRFEAFGDLNNTIQVANYFKIAENNPHVLFALWTKNPWIIAAAMKEFSLVKPENLRIIGSSYFLDVDMSDYYKKYDFIDNVFTVYRKKTAKTQNIEITCGARNCAMCGKCYTGEHKDFEIRELKK